MPTRRDVLKLSLVATGAGLAAPKDALAQLCLDDGLAPYTVEPSPSITPFIAPLYIPPIIQPVPESSLWPPPDPSRHQRFNEFRPQKWYVQHEQQFLWDYHPQLRQVPTWGWDGSSPGPTFHTRYGEPIFVRRYNELPLDPGLGWGSPTTTIHLHNFHTASESDGNPVDWKSPGEYWDHHYANYPAGGNESEKLTSLWYHDHMMDFTAPNVYAGLSGFYFLFDELDSGDENDPDPQAWRLPSGKYDVPLMLHDVQFGRKPGGGPDEAIAVFNPFQTDGWLGDTMTVNRTAVPYLQVEPRKYRFRFQNGGPSRYYRLYLSTGQSFTVVCSDGNFLDQPHEVDSIEMAVAERHDCVLDFSGYQPGDQILVENRLEQFEGRGPTGRIQEPGTGMPVMRFDVVPLTAPDNSRIPAVLRPQPTIDLSEVVRERTWVFDYDQFGLWTVNGRLFDNTPLAEVKEGTAEIWTIRNGGSNWSHPVHIHFEEFQILEWNGRPLPPDSVYRAKKDVINLGPNDEVKVFFRFRDFLGKYVMHCHNVVHEDHAMMIRWDIVP
jgi:FtsP/CotA-like multicopper oxidase with cupredoxin domain